MKPGSDEWDRLPSRLLTVSVDGKEVARLDTKDFNMVEIVAYRALYLAGSGPWRYEVTLDGLKIGLEDGPRLVVKSSGRPVERLPSRS